MTGLKNFIAAISPVSDKSWEQLSALFKEKQLLKNDYFIKEGETATEIAFLTSGIVRAFFRNEEGLEYNKTFFVAPCFFGGYSSLITGMPNQINHQALADCNILVANYAEFTALYDQYPDIERASRKLAELYFVHKEQREIEIVLLDADKRYLLFQKQFPDLEQLVAQYHIASYLGITATQLSRIRKKFASR